MKMNPLSICFPVCQVICSENESIEHLLSCLLGDEIGKEGWGTLVYWRLSSIICMACLLLSFKLCMIFKFGISVPYFFLLFLLVCCTQNGCLISRIE